MKKVCPVCRGEFDATDECPKDHVKLLPIRRKDAWVGRVMGGRYQLDSCVGEGGMGLVYRARDRADGNRSVAVKLLPLEQDDESQDHAARFVQEARLIQRLRHPGIVRYLAEGRTPDAAYLVMEFLRGMTLGSAMPSDGLHWFTAVSVMVDICAALEEAHRQGIIHRDMKADNVFVARQQDGTARIKVIDFGLAKEVDGAGPALTDLGHVVGSAGYVAPEHILGGRTFTAQSDVYALGALLFMLLTGHPPYHGMPLSKVMKAQVNQPLPPLGLSAGHPALLLEPVVHRAMHRDVKERHASVGAFHAAMTDAVQRLPRPQNPDMNLGGMDVLTAYSAR